MNPRQRRGVLLIGVSLAGALAVFLSVGGYVADVRAQVGPTGPVLQLVADVDAFQPVTARLVEEVAVPTRWRPANALTDLEQLFGAEGAALMAPAALPAGTVLQEGMLVTPPAVEAGMREVAILVSADTGVAGRVTPGSVVDVIATVDARDTGSREAIAVLQEVTVVSVGAPVSDGPLLADADFAGERVPITFVLPPADVLRLTWVESFASTVRLSLRTPTDPTVLSQEEATYSPTSGVDVLSDPGSAPGVGG